MPYYGSDFEGAMKGYTPITKWSYLCALWHYWHHTHCAGLPDDDTYLMTICECQIADWSRVKAAIFCGKPFFYQDGGKWHQTKAAQTWEDAVKSYQKRLDQTAAATEARLAMNVTSNVTSDVALSKPKPKPKQ